MDPAVTLDEWGRPAWVITTIFAFILAPLIGFILLCYLAWTGRLGRLANKGNQPESLPGAAAGNAPQPTGHRAFDDYRDETLRRLYEEQQAFLDFLDRLRRSKDQAEFDQFMAERRPPNR